jgi:hypothetical protein
LDFYSFVGALNFEIPEKLQDLPYFLGEVAMVIMLGFVEFLFAFLLVEDIRLKPDKSLGLEVAGMKDVSLVFEVAVSLKSLVVGQQR